MERFKPRIGIQKSTKLHSNRRSKIGIGAGLMVAILLASGCYMPQIASAEGCPDVKIIFARGSGGERWTNADYVDFRDTLEAKLRTTSINYEFVDLDYPAVAVGLEHLDTSLGAFVGGGESYRFGESVNAGTDEIVRTVNNPACSETKYVLGGYSQGAIATLKSLGKIDANKVIYVATFGDPKLYLPEGEGVIPLACSGENLSDYRMYVPDCEAYQGLLGGAIPYEPEEYVGKLGTWCNKRDLFCSSHFSISDHLGYVSDALYEDASRVIFDKITDYYGVENHISSPHDTAILIDSTGSMSSMISQYKAEAARLARETLGSGGRVALYDYRDLGDPYTPVEHCNFETCTMEVFESELTKIRANGGGDTPESLLSASFYAMKNLNWKYGATKSLVVLTDADFLSPDRDGMTFDEVVKLSKKIDPVNFYIITKEKNAESYKLLAEATDGLVVTDFDKLSLLTDYIMERYDSLPRVEEAEALEITTRPTLAVENVKQEGDAAIIEVNTDGEKVIVILNDALLGATDQTEITITGLQGENRVVLVPVSGDLKGEGATVVVYFEDGGMGMNVDGAVLAPKTGVGENNVF